MFSKNGDRLGLGGWPRSLTGRLTLLYVGSTLGMLLFAVVVLYWSLAGSLEREDNEFLRGKVEVLRTILRDRPTSRGALEEEVKWESATRPAAAYYARILDQRGRTLMETPGMSRTPASTSRFPPPVAPEEAPPRPRRCKAGNGRVYLLLSATAKLGSGPEWRVVQAALDVSPEAAILANYRRTLALVLLCGGVLSAVAGVITARRGMRPLTEVARRAQHITAARLHERLDPARWPGELTALATAFNDMLGRLEDSFARLSQFSASLAHELRTPVNNLMGEAEVALRETRTPEDYRQVLESSLEEYGRLARMIEALLFLARADSTQVTLQRRSLDARAEIEAVREFYEAAAEEQQVTVACQGEGVVDADSALFRRALGNLLANALQHTPAGGRVTLSVLATADHGLAVTVTDTGRGVAPEHIPRLFDRFYRVDGARSRNPEGMGLGLALVKSIMDLHQGTVTLSSAPGEGATVTLRFPPVSSLET